jgi:hypothetical protein
MHGQWYGLLFRHGTSIRTFGYQFQLSWKYSILWQKQEVAWAYRLLKEDLFTMTGYSSVSVKTHFLIL